MIHAAICAGSTAIVAIEVAVAKGAITTPRARVAALDASSRVCCDKWLYHFATLLIYRLFAHTINHAIYL